VKKRERERSRGCCRCVHPVATCAAYVTKEGKGSFRAWMAAWHIYSERERQVPRAHEAAEKGYLKLSRRNKRERESKRSLGQARQQLVRPATKSQAQITRGRAQQASKNWASVSHQRLKKAVEKRRLFVLGCNLQASYSYRKCNLKSQKAGPSRTESEL